MDQDLFISILAALSPEAIDEINKKPVQAECVFTQEPDYDDEDEFVTAYRPFVLQIRDNYLVECEPKSKKIFGGFMITLDYRFEIKRFPYDSESELGEPYALVLYLPQRYGDEEELVIKYGVRIEGAAALQKFADCLEQKVIFQLDIHSNFKVMERLFTSSTATMYSTTRDKDQKELVIKCIRKELFRMTGRDVKKGIERQYAIPHNLKHQNICKYYGVFQNDQAVYIVMEKLFSNLLQFLQMRLAKSAEQLRQILWKICTAVNVLHENFVMHRDLKLKVGTDQYEPVLIDFGLAEYEEKEPFMFVKCGTPGYTAPEICSTSQEKPFYDRSCDIFSLGCIFHFILIGRPLFEALTVQQLIEKNGKCVINPEESRYKILKENEKDLLFKMLQKDPKKRIAIKQILIHEFFSAFHPKPENVLKQDNSVSEADQIAKVES